MKREASSSPIPSSSDFDSPKKAKAPNASASPHTPKKKSKDGNECTPSKSPGGSWTPKKREDLIDKLLLAGLKAVKAQDIAAEVSPCVATLVPYQLFQLVPNIFIAF